MKFSGIWILALAALLAEGAEYQLNFQRGTAVQADAGKNIISGWGQTNSVEGRECLEAKGSYDPLVIKTPECIKGEQGSISFYYMPQLTYPENNALQFHTFFYSENNNGDNVQIGMNVYNKDSVIPYFLVTDTPAGTKNYGPYQEYNIKLNRWHHFEVSFDKERMLLLIDGNLVQSCPRKGAIPWGESIYIGGKLYGNAKAEGLLSNIVFSDTPIAFRGVQPLKMVQKKSGTHFDLQQLKDNEKGYFFYFESPESEAEITVTPGIFQIKKGDRFWVENTGGKSFETIAETDGSLIIKSDPTIFSQIMIARTEPNVAGNVSFETVRLNADTPTVFGRYEWMDIAPWWQEKGTLISPMKKSSSVKLTTDQSGKAVVARSEKITLTAGKKYIFTVDYTTQDTMPGNGFLPAVIVEGDQGKEYFTTGYNFRRQTLKQETMQLTFTFTVPADFQNPHCRLLLIATGKPFSVTFKDIDLRQEPYRHYKIPRALTAKQTEPKVTADQLNTLLAKRTPSILDTEKVNGKTVLTVDGQKVPYLSYYAFPNWRGCREFAEDGYSLQYVFLESGRGNYRFWKGPGQYDFTAFDEYMKQVLCAAPDANILLSLSCNPYFGFSDAYPDSVTRNEKGEKLVYNWLPAATESVSDPFMTFYGSPDYLREASAMIAALCKHLETSPYGKAIVGVHIKGGWDEQWFPPHFVDRSPDSLKMFRAYLKEVYQNDLSLLQKAWGDESVTFETAGFVDLREGTGKYFLNPANSIDRKVIDMLRYRSKYVVDTILSFAGVFRKEMNRKLWLSAYYSDGMAGSDLGKERLFELLSSDRLDGIASCMPYGGFRLIGEAGGNYSHMASIDLHGKKLYSELDYRTEFSNYSERGGAGYDGQTAGGAKGHQEHLMQMRRDLGRTFAANQGGWFFSLAGLTWADDTFRSHVREAMKVGRDIMTNPTLDHAQMAVFMDDDATCYSRIGDFSFRLEQFSAVELLRILNLCGLSYDSYLLEDLTNAKRPSYRMNYFGRTPHLNQEQIEYIQKNLQKDHQVLIFSFDAARLADGSMTENIRKLTGMTVKVDESKDIIYRNLPGASRSELGKTLDYTPTEMVGPLIYIEDDQVEVLARYQSDKTKVSAAMRRFDDWTAIFIASPNGVTPEFLHSVAKLAGITPVTDQAGDSVSAGNNLISIHAMSSGSKTIRWDGKCDLVDLATDEVVAKNADCYSFEMKVGESRWFKQKKD